MYSYEGYIQPKYCKCCTQEKKPFLCHGLVGWLCWGLTSQSTIFQSCRDGAIASWVINQYFRGVKCLAKGHNTAAVGLEPRTSRSGVRHSTTEPPRSPPLPWQLIKFSSLELIHMVDWLQSETLICLKKKMMFFINFHLWWN